MPEKIELSTKVIALITGIVALVSATVALRKKKESDPGTSSKAKIEDAATPVWELFRFLCAFVSVGFLVFGELIGFKWMSALYQSLK